jgi:hypothetical protein
VSYHAETTRLDPEVRGFSVFVPIVATLEHGELAGLRRA